MKTIPSEQTSNPTLPPRKCWETPTIIFERSLQAMAQGGPPVGPSGFLGPLNTSGDTGQCKT